MKTFILVKDISELRERDLVTNRGSGQAYIVTQVLGASAVVVRTTLLTNPSEWLVLRDLPEEAK